MSWRKLIKNNNFVFIWISQIFSQLTINILNYTIIFSLFEKTGSSIATSLVWIFYALPVILIGPFAASSADMIDRRKILIITNFLQSMVILPYALLSATHNYLVYAVVVIYSSINQFYVPAEFATIPFVVDRKNLPEANSLFLVTQQVALLLGFGFSGLLLNFIGFKYTLLICSLFLIISFISTTFLPSMKIKTEVPNKFDEIVLKFFTEIFVGYRFIKNNKMVLAPFLILIFTQISLSIITVNAPAIAQNIVGVPLNMAGIYLIVPAGMGAVLASFRIPFLLSKKIRKIVIIKNSLINVFLSLLLFVFVFSYLEDNIRLLFDFLLILIIGYSYVGILVPTQTFLQQKTPFDLRGRVFGNYWFLVTLLSVFPVILSGTITDIFGVKILFGLLLIGILLLYIILGKRDKIYVTSNNFT